MELHELTEQVEEYAAELQKRLSGLLEGHAGPVRVESLDWNCYDDQQWTLMVKVSVVDLQFGPAIPVYFRVEHFECQEHAAVMLRDKILKWIAEKEKKGWGQSVCEFVFAGPDGASQALGEKMVAALNEQVFQLGDARTGQAIVDAMNAEARKADG